MNDGIFFWSPEEGRCKPSGQITNFSFVFFSIIFSGMSSISKHHLVTSFSFLYQSTQLVNHVECPWTALYLNFILYPEIYIDEKLNLHYFQRRFWKDKLIWSTLLAIEKHSVPQGCSNCQAVYIWYVWLLVAVLTDSN